MQVHHRLFSCNILQLANVYNGKEEKNNKLSTQWGNGCLFRESDRKSGKKAKKNGERDGTRTRNIHRDRVAL